jgi:hypothetical protein
MTMYGCLARRLHSQHRSCPASLEFKQLKPPQVISSPTWTKIVTWSKKKFFVFEMHQQIIAWQLTYLPRELWNLVFEFYDSWDWFALDLEQNGYTAQYCARCKAGQPSKCSHRTKCGCVFKPKIQENTWFCFVVQAQQNQCKWSVMQGKSCRAKEISHQSRLYALLSGDMYSCHLQSIRCAACSGKGKNRCWKCRFAFQVINPQSLFRWAEHFTQSSLEQ